MAKKKIRVRFLKKLNYLKQNLYVTWFINFWDYFHKVWKNDSFFERRMNFEIHILLWVCSSISKELSLVLILDVDDNMNSHNNAKEYDEWTKLRLVKIYSFLLYFRQNCQYRA